LKLKDRGFKDTELSTGLAYMVNEGPYQAHMRAAPNAVEPVGFYCLFVSIDR
jgi:hypothetical protein